jgi:hypothetical protein
MRLYTYAIINSKDEIDESITGLERSSVYNIAYRDIGVVASELNEEINQITDNSALEHEKVVERLMTNFTVLPMRFLTIFNTKEDLLSMLAFYYEDFKNNLERLSNKVEFGIKVIWPADPIRQRIIEAYNKTRHNVSVSMDSPAKSFLKEKLEKHIIDKEFEEEANRCIAVIDGYFNKIACEKKLKKLQTENLLLNSSYLVDKDRQNDFKQAFEQLRSAPGDLKFLFSGPWPCYNFVTLTKKPASTYYFGVEDILDKLIKQQDLREKV